MLTFINIADIQFTYVLQTVVQRASINYYRSRPNFYLAPSETTANYIVTTKNKDREFLSASLYFSKRGAY